MIATAKEISANEAIEFGFVSGSDNSNMKTLSFHPAFTYPFLGEEEVILTDEENLKIPLLYASGSLYSYSNYDAALITELGIDTKNYDNFIAQAQRKWKPMGSLYHLYKVKDSSFEVYATSSDTPNFLPYHVKLQTLTKFFIEGASYCNIADEPLWQIFTLYKREDDIFHLVGFITAYQFYSYPNSIRYRISQFLILPPYQRQGHGCILYGVIYNNLILNSRVSEITVEDPNDDFQELRDKSDLRLLLERKVLEGQTAPIDLKTLEDIKREFKLNKRQVRRCCEIILLKALDKKNVALVTAYRLYVKKRIYLQNQEVLEDMEKSERIAQLQKTYVDVEEDYLELIGKL